MGWEEQLDATLRAAWKSPEGLPPPETWLASARSEAAQAQYAYLLLKKHLARVDAVIKHDELPKSWFGFSWLFYLNIDELARQGSHSAMLRELFAKVVRFTQAISAEYFVSNLYELMKNVIEERRLCSLVEPLLPPEASAKMDEMKEMLNREREDDRRRADEGYY